MQIDHQDLRRRVEASLPEVLEMLRQMVAINSFTANPEGVNRLGKLTAQAFSQLGFESRAIPAGRAGLGDHLVLEKWGDKGSKGPTIAMVSHLDTVFPAEEEEENDFRWRPEGRRIYGPGTVDIKGGTAMMFLVLLALRSSFAEVYEATNWILLFNAAEEILEPEFGRAAREVIPPYALASLVFEGGRMRGDRFYVVAARKGMATYVIEAEGKAAHAGANHQRGANAITQLARAVDAVASFTDYDRDITFNIGAFHGGTVSNRVPHYAAAEGEMRAYSAGDLAEGIKRLRALGDASADENNRVRSHAGDFACEVRVKIQRQWAPMPPNDATDSLLATWQAAAQDMGYEVVRQERGGLSDANFIWDHVPTLDGLGPSGGNAHCSERTSDGNKDQEYLDLPSLAPKATLNALAILRVLEPHLRAAPAL